MAVSRLQCLTNSAMIARFSRRSAADTSVLLTINGEWDIFHVQSSASAFDTSSLFFAALISRFSSTRNQKRDPVFFARRAVSVHRTRISRKEQCAYGYIQSSAPGGVRVGSGFSPRDALRICGRLWFHYGPRP
jgi:hypothetical protein